MSAQEGVDRFYMDMRASFHQETEDGEYNSQMVGEYLNLHLLGHITPKIDYRIRQRLNKKVFDYAYAHKDELQQQVSVPLIWERLDDKVTCRIKVEKEIRPFEVEDRTPIFAFLAQFADEMYTAFHNCLVGFKG